MAYETRLDVKGGRNGRGVAQVWRREGGAGGVLGNSEETKKKVARCVKWVSAPRAGVLPERRRRAAGERISERVRGKGRGRAPG